MTFEGKEDKLQENVLSKYRKRREELYKELELTLPYGNVNDVSKIPINWIEEYIQKNPEMRSHLTKMINDWTNE